MGLGVPPKVPRFKVQGLGWGFKFRLEGRVQSLELLGEGVTDLSLDSSLELVDFGCWSWAYDFLLMAFRGLVSP